MREPQRIDAEFAVTNSKSAEQRRVLDVYLGLLRVDRFRPRRAKTDSVLHLDALLPRRCDGAATLHTLVLQ